MQAVQTHKHIPDRPTQLTGDWIRNAYAQLAERVANADSDDDWISLVADWNSTKSYVESEHWRRHYRLMKDMADQSAEESEREVREEFVPIAEAGDAAMATALLASSHKEAVAKRFGEQLLTVLEVRQGPLADVNSKQRVAVGELASRYDKIVAAGEVEVLGETLTLSKARGMLVSEDAATRRAAFEAYFGWFADHRDALAQLYADQVALRDEMGRNLGHKNFVPLGFDAMERTDYGPAEVAQFHAAVRKHVVPLFKQQAAAQAAALGTETLRPWDASFFPGRSLPMDVCRPVDQQLDKTSRLFKRLSPRLSAHFERMRSEGLIDLENRKGKAAGAFCTSFPDEGRVAIFCNSVGDESDVATLTHELGHAFQAWESQAIESVDLQWPTSDGAEVHSMGMEFLSLPYLDEFFTKDQLAKFTRARWDSSISLLCYVCVVDAFQQWIYETPAATLDERDSEWKRLVAIYMPGIDWSGDAAAFAHTRWYAQGHIFGDPFYYIDYAIAETGAMQFALLDAKDHDACLETYIDLCKLGGTKSVIALFESAGLRSPFDPEVMGDLMDHAATQV